MQNVKIPTSKSYHEYLISSLKDPERAAAYIEEILDLEAEAPEPKLLQAAIKDIVDAHFQMNNLSDEAKLAYQKLDRILSETEGAEIYSFVQLLNGLGFRIAISFAGARSAIAQDHDLK